VNSIVQNDVVNCSGHLRMIIREDDGKQWELNEQLTFAPLENKDSIAKTVRPNKPEFLDVFHIVSLSS
jgi:hypothetical protein